MATDTTQGTIHSATYAPSTTRVSIIVNAVPITMAFEHGQVVSRFVGDPTAAALETWIDKLPPM